MISKPKVSVVIPNWNGEGLLHKNLPVILKASEKVGNRIGEIIVVDDGSTDGSVNLLKREFGRQIRLVVHGKNKGFASAANTGFRYTKYELVCLLNTDVLPSGDFLANVLPHFNDKRVFAVGLHEGGYGPSTAQFVDGYFGHASCKESRKVNVSMWASGGSAVFRKKIWCELHGLDDELLKPFYWEDVDISYRAWKRGYKILWEPSASVSHVHQSVINSKNFRKKYMELVKERNELLFIWKNITSKTLRRKHKNALIRRTLNHPGYLMVVLFALKKGSLTKQRYLRELRQSKLSDEAVFSIFK